MSPDYLLIGHLTDDLTARGVVPGGTVLYAALTAQRLGRKVAIVTHSPDAAALAALLPGIALHVLPTGRATTFENIYHGDEREQWLRHVAPPIRADEVPEAWRGSAIVHLAPVAQEVAPDLMSAFPGARLCATPQGWLRAWGADGRVRYAPLADPRRFLAPLDVMVLSAEDVANDRAALETLVAAVPLAVETRAAAGAVVYAGGEARAVAAHPTAVVDATGAGDVFAAAYFVCLDEGGEPMEAARFAAVAASLAIAGAGTSTIPTRAEIERAQGSIVPGPLVGAVKNGEWRMENELP